MQELNEEMLDDIKNLNLDSLQQALDNEENFMPRVHIFGEDNVYVVFMPFQNDEEKIKMLSEVGSFAYEKKAHQIIFVSDSFMKHYDNEKDVKTAMDNWDTERPSLYPADRRQEVLLIFAMDFKNSKKEKFIMIPYKTENKRIRALEESKELHTEVSSLIKTVIAESLIRAKLTDTLKRKEIIPETFLRTKPEDIELLMKEFRTEVEEEYPNILTNLLQKI